MKEIDGVRSKERKRIGAGSRVSVSGTRMACYSSRTSRGHDMEEGPKGLRARVNRDAERVKPEHSTTSPYTEG